MPEPIGAYQKRSFYTETYKQAGAGAPDINPGGRFLSPVSPFFHKDVVRNGVPGIVNANEEQQQCRSSNAKQGLART